LDEKDFLKEHKPHKQLIEFVKDRPGHDRRYAMDIDKINRELGWTPQHNLQEGLIITVEWYLQNTDWLNAIIKEKNYQNWIKLNYQKRGNP
jgi:dTDP-glucose 4,6-dehydratase